MCPESRSVSALFTSVSRVFSGGFRILRCPPCFWCVQSVFRCVQSAFWCVQSIAVCPPCFLVYAECFPVYPECFVVCPECRGVSALFSSVSRMSLCSRVVF